MRRTAFDTLMAAAGLVLTAVLVTAAGLLFWGHSFVSGQVHDQLAAQRIYFPAAGSAALNAKEFPTLQQFGGEQVVTGEQARAYADEFIGAHLKAIGGGQTYSQLSARALANPSDQALAGQVQTMFRGETLRGLLLNAYAFGTMAKVALYGAWVALIGAAIMLVLSGLGLMHARQVLPEAEVLVPHGASPITV
jgi:hypothetical protein